MVKSKQIHIYVFIFLHFVSQFTGISHKIFAFSFCNLPFSIFIFHRLPITTFGIVNLSTLFYATSFDFVISKNSFKFLLYADETQLCISSSFTNSAYFLEFFSLTHTFLDNLENIPQSIKNWISSYQKTMFQYF